MKPTEKFPSFTKTGETLTGADDNLENPAYPVQVPKGQDVVETLRQKDR
jgi:hypothetical protein